MRPYKNLLFFSFIISSILLQGQSSYLYIGSYTDALPSEGIKVYSFDMEDGSLTKIENGLISTNTSFLTFSPDHKYLYSVSEAKMPGRGSVSAYGIDRLTGKLNFINKRSSWGDNPVYVDVDPSGKWLINGNYTGGSMSIHKIIAGGSIEPAAQKFYFPLPGVEEAISHVHSTVFSPNGDQLIVPDLGADKVRIYDVDVESDMPLKLSAQGFVATKKGSGPRHFTFDPNGEYGYLIEELSGHVSVYKYENKKLEPVQRIAAQSKGTKGPYSSADIHISNDGKFLYTTNRADINTIAVFKINKKNGKLKLIETVDVGGNHPRNFTIDPSGKFVLIANTNSNNVVVFKRNVETGRLTSNGTQIEVKHPSCLRFLYTD